jgi:hypothetical protein
VGARRAKHMRADTDDPSRVRDPAVEWLLNHTVTLTDGPSNGSRPACR